MADQMPRKVFVVGGAGFIGSHLVDRLAESCIVTVYDDLSSGSQQFIEHHQGSSRFRFVQADVLDYDTLYEAMDGHDVVFHLAANPDARSSVADTRLDLRIGTLATFNVLEAMRLHGIRKLVFSSSGMVYGEPPFVPLSESYGPLLPISLYGASKLASEGLISAFCHTFGLQAWVFRFANIVGGRATHGVAFDLIGKLRKDPTQLEVLGDGKQEKSYVLVDDCVDAVLYGVEHSTNEVNLFHIGCDSTTDVATIADMVIEEMGLNGVKKVFTGGERGWRGDVPLMKLDVGKLNALGWCARWTSTEAVGMAIRRILGKPDD